MLDVGQLYNFAKLHTIRENKKILSELEICLQIMLPNIGFWVGIKNFFTCS